LRLAAGWPLPRRWRLLISWLVAIGLILWLLAQACPEYPRRVDLPGVRSSLRLGNPAWLVAALLSVVATLVLRVGRWRWLLSGAAGGHPAWASLWRATLWGQGLNMLLPLRAGDLARAYGIGSGAGAGAAYALGTIVAEKLLDLAGLGAAVLLILLLSGPGLAALGVLVPISRVGILLLALSIGLGLAWFFSRRPLAVQGVQHLAHGLAVLSRPAVLAPALAWSLPLWLAQVFNNYATARALALRLDWAGALLVWVVLLAGLAPPSTPAKIGVFQALCMASLGLLGYGSVPGLAYGLWLQLVLMLPPLALLLLDLLRESWP
jgi:uncharacterized membrane protein YbhN (UPF0104 family)